MPNKQGGGYDSKIWRKLPPQDAYLALVMYDNLQKSKCFAHKDGYLGPRLLGTPEYRRDCTSEINIGTYLINNSKLFMAISLSNILKASKLVVWDVWRLALCSQYPSVSLFLIILQQGSTRIRPGKSVRTEKSARTEIALKIRAPLKFTVHRALPKSRFFPSNECLIFSFYRNVHPDIKCHEYSSDRSLTSTAKSRDE